MDGYIIKIIGLLPYNFLLTCIYLFFINKTLFVAAVTAPYLARKPFCHQWKLGHFVLWDGECLLLLCICEPLGQLSILPEENWHRTCKQWQLPSNSVFTTVRATAPLGAIKLFLWSAKRYRPLLKILN